MLILALLPTINPLLLMWFVRIYDTKEQEEKKLLNAISCVALLLAAYLMAVIIVDHLFIFQLLVRVPTFVVLLLLLSSPLCIVLSLRARVKDSPVIHQSLISTRDSLEEYNLNLLQAMGSVNFWILFFAMACGMGSGLATVNNLGQIGESLGYSNSQTNTFVSLWSIWNFLGRFGAGYVSDHFLYAKGWARPLFMVLTLSSMSVGHAVIASGMPGALYAGSILVGVCYGSQWSLMPTIASEIFGVKHMGTVFNAITIASPVGSYIFSVRVVGFIYDKEAWGSGCGGTHCFMLSFLIMASATLLGSLAALALFFHVKNFYTQVILRRLLHSLRE